MMNHSIQGICGIVYSNIFHTAQLIYPMLEHLKHRGPFPQHTHFYSNAELGVSGGNFASNRNRTLIAAVDGNINFQDSETMVNKSGTSADRLIHAYEKWGNRCFENLTGSYSCMILDQKKNSLFLARDGIGKKPLYWFHDGRHFIFSSELKALLSTDIVPQTPSDEAIASYLYFGYIPQDLSPIKGTHKLLPGYSLHFKLNHQKQIYQFYSLSKAFKSQYQGTPEMISNHLDTLLSETINENLDSKKNVGCFLQGGIGSACIAYYVSKAFPKSLIGAYSSQFQDSDDDDLNAAKEFAENLKIEHRYEMISKESFFNDLVRISWYLDEPIADPTSVATWKIVQMAKKHTGTLFSGMGSDELLVGHSRYTINEQSKSVYGQFLDICQPCIKNVIIPLLSFFYPTASFNLLRHLKTNPRQFDYILQNAQFTQDQFKKASPYLSQFFDPEVYLHQFYNLANIPSTTSSLVYFDMKTRLVDNFCLQYDRLTASQGISWYTPFLDQKVLEFLASIPEPEELEIEETGIYLKRILEKVYPKKLIERPKVNRKYFLNHWMKTEPFTQYFELLTKGHIVETGLISQDWLKETIKKLHHPDSYSFRYLYSLLSLEIWFRLYIDRPVSKDPPDISIKDLLT